MWAKVVACITGIGLLIGGYIFLDDRYSGKFALADELRKTNYRLEQKILQDQVFYIQKQMQYIEYKCGTSNPNIMPEHARARYNDFRIEIKSVERELNNLKKGKQEWIL